MNNEEFNKTIDQIGEAYEAAKDHLTNSGIAGHDYDSYCGVLRELQQLREISVSAVQDANVSWQRIQRLEKGSEVNNA